MTGKTKTILCGACRIPVEGPADPQDQDMITCPSCGRSDNFKNVVASVEAFLAEAAGNHLQEAIRQAARRSKFIKATLHPIQKGDHPFIIDFEF